MTKPTLATLLHMAGVKEAPPLAHKLPINDNKGDKECVWPPFPHQVTEISRSLLHVRYGMFGEPGTGKTLPAQAVALYYIGYGNKVVVVMPPILITQFVASIKSSFIGVEKHVSIHVLRDGPADRKELFGEWEESGWPDIICMSYMMFINALYERVSDPNNPGKTKRKQVAQNVYRYLKDAGYGVFIADEAQFLRNTTSHSHKAFTIAAGFPQRPTDPLDFALLLLTGTPIHNTFEDAYGLIRLLRPWQYGSRDSFERVHCEYVGHGRNKKLIGYKNLAALHRNLYASAGRYLRKDVFDMKEPIVQEVPITLTKEHKALYDKLVRERFLEVGDRIIEATNASSLRQKCLRMVTTPEMFTDKKITNNIIVGLDALLDSIGVEDNKVVLFAYYQESVESIHRHCMDAGLNPALVYGGNSSQAPKEVEKFKNDPTCRVAVLNPLSGGVGLNLQHVCHYAIFVEPLSVPGTFKQAAERILRPGQLFEVMIYILKALGTSSPKLTEDMLRKEGVAKIVNNDATSLMDELMGVTSVKEAA